MTLTDYDRIARAIRYLEARAPDQPPLAEVARAAGLSPHHFQRLFTRWAGISPKRFLQFLTLGHAKRLLAGHGSVLETALETGLSGPGRLHDLFVTAEGVTPGEFKGAGAGLDIAWGVHPSPFGPCFLAASVRGVVALRFLERPADRPRALADLRVDWPRAAVAEDPAATAPLAGRIFEPARWAEAAPLAVLLKGTNFQLKVWEALLRIPPGRAATYGQVATAVGTPGAARAVGGAVARNPVAFLVPCHRVIRAGGDFGEYRWGAVRKRAMLLWEAGPGEAWPLTGDAAAARAREA